MMEHNGHGVLLLDHYDEMAEMLRASFRASGFQGEIVSLEDDGFLPEDVLSLYQWFCRDSVDSAEAAVSASADYRVSHAGWTPGKPRYFDQIELPDYWEISGSAASGEVHDLHKLRGRIFYHAKSGERQVSDVDWLNEQGIARCTDHYDRRGFLYARTIFNKKGEKFCRSWFDDKGRERVVENYVTRDILVNRNGMVSLYRNRTELATAMIRELGAAGSRMYYNSLSTPLFVTEKLKAPKADNILFWQEGPREDIPGNMKLILDGDTHTSKILVQNRESYEKLIALGASAEKVHPFGFVYPFCRQNTGGKDVLICTNSDQIEELEKLVTAFPEMTFHIAAVTEMSARLLAFGKYANVFLYPTVRNSVVDDLYQKCDWYLDINHGSEILTSVKRAFLNDQLILGFAKTLHRPRYVASAHIFNEAEELCRCMRKLTADPQLFREHLNMQKTAAMSEKKEGYRKLWDRR